MNFQTAIKSGFQNYANFNGRSSRSAYWFWELFVVIAANLTSAIFSAIGVLFSIAMIAPSIAFGWRRMHDTGRAGWWSIIPIVVLFRVRVRIRIVDIALDDVVDQTWAGIVVVDIDR